MKLWRENTLLNVSIRANFYLSTFNIRSVLHAVSKFRLNGDHTAKYDIVLLGLLVVFQLVLNEFANNTFLKFFYIFIRKRIYSFFTERAFARAVLEVVILSVCPSVRLSHAWIVTKLNDLLQIF